MEDCKTVRLCKGQNWNTTTQALHEHCKGGALLLILSPLLSEHVMTVGAMSGPESHTQGVGGPSDFVRRHVWALLSLQ